MPVGDPVTAWARGAVVPNGPSAEADSRAAWFRGEFDEKGGHRVPDAVTSDRAFE